MLLRFLHNGLDNLIVSYKIQMELILVRLERLTIQAYVILITPFKQTLMDIQYRNNIV